MKDAMRALTADEIDFIAGGLLDTNIVLALAIQTQVANNLAVGGFGTQATQSVTGVQASLASLLPH